MIYFSLKCHKIFGNILKYQARQNVLLCLKNVNVVEKEPVSSYSSSAPKNLIQIQPKPQLDLNQKYEPDLDSITYEAFTDGSTLGNGGRNALGGIGVYFPDQNRFKPGCS